MSPFGIAGLFVAGILAKMGYDRFRKGGAGALANPLAPLPGAQQSALVTTLAPGRMYTVVMMVDPKAVGVGDGKNVLDAQAVERASSQISTSMTQVGLTPLAAPVPGGDAAKVPSDKPSQWDMIARWEGPGAMISARPGFVTQINFYEVPSFG